MTRALPYWPRLDGLRGLAVTLVLMQHFAPWRWVAGLGLGGIGVKIFFVLSGFLISLNLLGYGDAKTGVGEAAAQFYWRRFLRLSPALWLAIFAAAALGLGNMRADWWVHAFYLSNFLVVARGGFGAVGHFWTLAVEEQFYIVWFVVVVLLPRRALLPFTLGFIALGPAYRAGLFLGGFSNFPQVLLPGNIDSLAAGAALALAWRGAPRTVAAAANPVTFWLGVAGVVALGALADGDPARRIAYPAFVNLASVALVAGCVAPSPRPSLAPLGLAPARHLGRISYGVYVFHYFFPLAAAAFLPGFAGAPAAVKFLPYVAASIVLAEVSWWAIERPARRWRDAWERIGRETPAG